MRTPTLTEKEIAHLIWIGNTEAKRPNAPGMWISNATIVGLARHKLVSVGTNGPFKFYRLTDRGREKYNAIVA